MELIGKEFNPHTGTLEEFHADGTGNYATRIKADVSSLITSNLQQQNLGNNGFSQSGEIRKIAEIDNVTQMKLLTEHHIDLNRWNADDQKGFKLWLRRPENRFFRTYSGNI